ncbi:MAG: hypothetical protein R3264_22495, partial [Anaerolineae bacterium]|nr:hypothetical protein [Anaerolineae bacterium]
MTNTQKITFQLTTYDTRLLVRASSPHGEAKAETALPAPALLDRLVPSTAFPAAVRSVGRALFDCLLDGAVGQLVTEALDERRQSRKSSLHFELRFDSDQLALTE